MESAVSFHVLLLEQTQCPDCAVGCECHLTWDVGANVRNRLLGASSRNTSDKVCDAIIGCAGTSHHSDLSTRGACNCGYRDQRGIGNLQSDLLASSVAVD